MSEKEPSGVSAHSASGFPSPEGEESYERIAPERIVVGVDGSPSSRRALQWAIHEAARCGSVLRIVSVLVPLEMGLESYEYGPPDRGLEARALERAHAWVQEAQQQARAVLPVDRVSSDVRIGGATEVLLEESRSADLMVLGSRGLGGFRGLLLGSVSQQCVAHAACPVVVVRGDHTVLRS